MTTNTPDIRQARARKRMARGPRWMMVAVSLLVVLALSVYLPSM